MLKNLLILPDSSQVNLFTPELVIRRNPRAKYLRLKTHHQHGVEVVVPGRMSVKHVAPFVRQHQDWINQQLGIHNQRKSQPLPDEIYLPALDQSWKIKYDSGLKQNFRVRESRSTIAINSPYIDGENCKRKLNQWLRTKAKTTLSNWLEDISQRINLPYKKVFIRSQRTCWGSCSQSNNISLNDHLLFLKPDVVEYVIIHELCHTRHMNHSRHFWNLVNTHCPQYKTLEKSLNNSPHTIPYWAY